MFTKTGGQPHLAHWAVVCWSLLEGSGSWTFVCSLVKKSRVLNPVLLLQANASLFLVSAPGNCDIFPDVLDILLPRWAISDLLQHPFWWLDLVHIFDFQSSCARPDHFESLYWICYNITSVLCFVFLATRHVGSWLPQASNSHPLHWVAVLPFRPAKFLYCFFRKFPSGPVVKTLCFHCQGPRYGPWLGH